MKGPRIVGAGIALGIVCAAIVTPIGAQSGVEGPDFQRQRQAWFNDQRAYPNREVDWEAMARVRQQFMMRAGNRGFASLADLSAGRWIPMGPYGFFGFGLYGSGAQLDAGRIDAIALHPTAQGTMLIASPRGGIWGTTDGGAVWTPRFDTQCTLSISTVTIDPVNPSIVYAAAADPSGAAGCALFRSTDGGANWTNWNGGLSFSAAFAQNVNLNNALYIDPSSAGSTTGTTLMFSLRGIGIYRSTNSGASWQLKLQAAYVTSIVPLPGQPGVVFAGVVGSQHAASSESGLYRSTDNGASWTKIFSSGSYAEASRFQLATSAAQPNSVWILAGQQDRKFGGIVRWDNATGQSVTLAASGVNTRTLGSGIDRTAFGQQAEYDLAIAVDPTNGSRIYIGGTRGYRSSDGGATFVPMATEIHADWHSIVVDPRNARRLYAGTDGGIFESTDGGDSWTSRNAGLAIAMYYPGIGQHPTDPNIVVGGTQDNGSMVTNGTPWTTRLSGGDGGYAAINYSSPTTVWSTCQHLCIYRSVSGINQEREAGIATTDRVAFIAPLVMDPVTPTTLYYGTMRLYRTINDGELWAPVSLDLTKGSGTINSLAIAQSDPQTIYVGTSDGNVQVTRNGGTTWTLSTTGLPNRVVTDFAIDRTNSARALVTLSGFGAPHVYLTDDAGATWKSASGNLPDIPATAVVMINDGTSHFFIGTDIGVFETTDAGLTWTISPSGLPNVVVHDLSYNPTTKQLVAATFGRGLFQYSLANASAVLRGDVNRNGVVNAADALLIQQALIGLPMPTGLTISPHGDANCDGKVDAADALIVLRAAVGLTSAGACVGTIR